MWTHGLVTVVIWIAALLAAENHAVLESLSGGAGWVGAGLLGGVLWWLLFRHLPAKDTQINKLLEDKDNHVKGLVDSFLAESKEARIASAEVMSKEREQRHKERDQTHSDNLKMALLLSENTQETRVLAQETRALSGSVGNLAARLEKK